ncbi:hypothetical protein PF008_g18772 [Phytophthora fragariae]|uniref:Secreted protein n=1 Tax=Phytophthora fragariae TaxID=53985 RepID=A0A6G0R4B6_9STRA|nr:hypothetical protein PF008_g18772 [Phytophthora fragariae]
MLTNSPSCRLFVVFGVVVRLMIKPPWCDMNMREQSLPTTNNQWVSKQKTCCLWFVGCGKELSHNPHPTVVSKGA